MTASTNMYMINRVIRIQPDERKLLYELRQIYGVDYKKHAEYLRHDANVPISVKEIYVLLDDRRAYRRISDYFHRERLANKTYISPDSGSCKSPMHSSIDGSTSEHELYSDMNTKPNQDDLSDKPLHSPLTKRGSDELTEPDYRTYSNLSQTRSRTSTHHQEQNTTLTKNECEQSHFHPTYLTPKSGSLQSVRESIQKALTELDQAISRHSSNTSHEYDDCRARSSVEKTDLLINDRDHSKLDDTFRTLSNIVPQQRENTSDPFADRTQESMQNVISRLNFLVDRGNSIYDQVENILSSL